MVRLVVLHVTLRYFLTHVFQTNSEASSQAQRFSLVTAWRRLSFILRRPEFIKKRDSCFAISVDTPVIHLVLNCHEFALTDDIRQYWMRRRPKRWPFSQSQDTCKRCVPFLQPAIWVCAREFSISCCLMSSRLVCCFQISSKHP